jgi:hypothetical protein
MRARYTRSTVGDGAVRLNGQGVHDDIRTLQWSEQSARVRLFFERNHGHRRSYPTCQRIREPLKGAYGKPQSVLMFQEEASHHRRFTWRHKGESMTLECFRDDRLARSRRGADVQPR